MPDPAVCIICPYDEDEEGDDDDRDDGNDDDDDVVVDENVASIWFAWFFIPSRHLL